MNKEIISAFAFKTGKQIEALIIKETDNLQEKNRGLEAKILQWFNEHEKDGTFATFFNIKENRGQ